MKKFYNSILAIAFALGMANTGLAQVSAYAFSQSSGTYNAITGGSVMATASAATGAGSMDDVVYNIPNGTFPFTFTFNGIGYTGCNVSSNGFITFGATAPGGTNYSPISGAALFEGSISAWCRDLNAMYSASTVALNGELRYEVVGSAPNREIVFQYKNWRPNYSSSTTNYYGLNFQIRLQETTNKVSIVYGPNGLIAGAVNVTNTLQVGLRGATNADYNNRLNAAAVSFTASTNGVANTSTQTYSTTGTTPGMPTNGLTYEWTPPTPCSGTPNAGMAIASLTSVCTPTNVNLNLSGSTSGVTGLTYQWFSSPDGMMWNAISNATTMATTQSVTASTYYQAVVNCGANSATSTPVQVQIATTTTNTVPYFEGFEGISAAGQLPNCSWTKTGDWTTNIGAQSNNRFPRTGTKYAHTSWSTIAGGDYIYSNGIQLTAGVTYSANAYYVVDGAAGWDEVSMLYGTTQSTTGLVNIATLNNLTNTAYLPINGTFSVSSTGIYYLAFKAVAPTTTPWYLSIDDISLDVAPACVTPPAIGSITGPSSVNINTANQYTLTSVTGSIQWYQGNSATGPWTAISNATTTPQNITFNQAGTKFLTAIASNPGCPNDTVNTAYQVTVIFPGNDVCSAIPLTLGTSSPYSLFGATTQTGEVAPPTTGCNTNNSWCNTTPVLHNSMWFTFTAPASGYVSVQSPGFDTQLALWKAANCSDLLSSATATLIAANDDDLDYVAHGGVNYSSYVKAACLTPGATYFIQLDSYSAALSTETTSIVITDLGSLNASFSGLAANYCLPAASSSLTPATVGGIFTINTNTTSVTAFTPSVTGVGTHTITYSIFGCQTMSTTVVANTPTVFAMTSNSAICTGSSATLTATGATNYTWTATGNNGTTEVVSPTSNTTYTLIGEDNGCTSQNVVSVDVNAVPVLTVTASNSPICAGETSTLTVTGATNYTWTSGGNASTEVVNPSTNTNYTVTGETTGCSSTATVSIDVNATPVLTVSASSSAVCASSSATLTAAGATNYTWTSGGNASTEVVTPSSNTTYTVTGETSGCSSTGTVSVDVNAIPTVVALASQTVLCDDGSTGAAVLTASTSATSYTWSEGSTTMSISVTPTVTTDYTVTVDELGCTNTATVSVMVTTCTGIKEHIADGISIFPNPNNGLVTISINANFSSNTTLEVYDAIGKLVIKETLSNEETTINTSKLTDGIYIYKIINNNKEAKVGRMIKQ